MATIKDQYAAVAAITCTLNSLASSSAGVGRQATLIDNTTNLYARTILSAAIKMGTSPTANTLVYIYKIESNNDGTPIIDDNAGASDAGLTIVNAPLIGVLVCPDATTGRVLSRNFDMSPLGPPGPKWAPAVVNATQVALSASGHVLDYIGVTQTVV